MPTGNENGNERFAAIIGKIKDNAIITLDELSAQTGVAKRTLSRQLKQMQESGIIRREGSARAGRWDIIKRP